MSVDHSTATGASPLRGMEREHEDHRGHEGEALRLVLPDPLVQNPPPRIDPELSALIPPLTADEKRQLEENIRRDGCRDPLVVWKETGVLLDGHHRFAICLAEGLPYQTVPLSLASHDEAEEWIILTQLGRRNLLPYHKTELALKLEPRIAARAKENRRRAGGAVPSTLTEPVDTREELARIAGVSTGTMHKARAIHTRAPETLKNAVRHGEISIDAAYQGVLRRETEERRGARREDNAAAVASCGDVASLAGRFSTVVVDPPWDYSDEGDADPFGRGLPTYATMPFEEILELPVGRLVDEDAHLYLWVTNRSLPKGFELIQAWGFRYAGCVTWCKPSFGMGMYFRGQTEHFLFGVKGSQPLLRHDVGTWFAAPRGKDGHSSKPEEFFSIVESCSPGPYLEMFSRRKREGWSAWGAEVGTAKGDAQ